MGGAACAGALAAAFVVAATQTAAAHGSLWPVIYCAPHVGGWCGHGARPWIMPRATYGAEHRWPYRPDLIVRVGPPGDGCEMTYEQTLTTDGLVWRPLVDCNNRY